MCPKQYKNPDIVKESGRIVTVEDDNDEPALIEPNDDGFVDVNNEEVGYIL